MPSPPPHWWENALQVAGKWKAFWWLVAAGLIAFGFDFKTPASQFQHLAQADSLKGRRIDSVVRALGTRDLINVGIARYLCFKDPGSATLFIPCSYLNSGSPPP